MSKAIAQRATEVLDIIALAAGIFADIFAEPREYRGGEGRGEGRGRGRGRGRGGRGGAPRDDRHSHTGIKYDSFDGHP